jgi:hypothetical protein
MLVLHLQHAVFYHTSLPQTTGTRVFTQVRRSLCSIKVNQDKFLALCSSTYPIKTGAATLAASMSGKSMA